jgi:hypothetical protein
VAKTDNKLVKSLTSICIGICCTVNRGQSRLSLNAFNHVFACIPSRNRVTRAISWIISRADSTLSRTW